jgi:hypothetical protein
MSTMKTIFDNVAVIDRADERFVLQEDADGRLFETSNAVTRAMVCGAMVGNSYPDRDGLIKMFGSEEIADRYLIALRDEDK